MVWLVENCILQSSVLKLLLLNETSKIIHNPSQTNSSGVGLYINSNLTYQPRNDLNLNNVGYESLFIEIPTSSGKPFITGVIYRHPTYAFQPRMNLLNLSPTFKTTNMTT